MFRSWGRVGTTIGGTKLEDFEDKHEAKSHFQYLYQDKTGNRWKDRKNFQKLPGKFFPMDLDLGQDAHKDEIKKLEVSQSKSKLPKAVQQLITLIFDIESMKKAMVEFEVRMCGLQQHEFSLKILVLLPL